MRITNIEKSIITDPFISFDKIKYKLRFKKINTVAILSTVYLFTQEIGNVCIVFPKSTINRTVHHF